MKDVQYFCRVDSFHLFSERKSYLALCLFPYVLKTQLISLNDPSAKRRKTTADGTTGGRGGAVDRLSASSAFSLLLQFGKVCFFSFLRPAVLFRM